MMNSTINSKSKKFISSFENERGDCSHQKTRPGYITGEYYGYEFKAKGEICAQCGAQSWTPEIIARFEAFKNKVAVEHKDKFKVQKIFVNDFTANFLEQTCKEFNVQSSTVVRALLISYFKIVRPEERLMNEFRKIEILKVFSSPKPSVRFGRLLFDEINSSAAVFDMPLNTYVSEVINRMSVLITKAQQSAEHGSEINPIINTFFEGTLEAA